MSLPPATPFAHKDVSPRKKKVQISFAQSSFSQELDEANNRKAEKDIEFLYAQLQNAKKEKEELTEHCETLESQLQAAQRIAKDATVRRQMEEESFRTLLGKSKTDFDRKLVKLSIKAKDRDDILLEWVTTVTDLSLHLQHDNLQDLRGRTLDLLPPSLRDLVGGGSNGRREGHTTGKSRTKKGASRRAGGRTSGPGGGAGAGIRTSVGSTDPDALLAIINENLNVLDNFNLQYLTGTADGTALGAAEGQGHGGGEGTGAGEGSDGSDIDAALIRGGYYDYLNSGGAGGAGKGPPHHYSGLSDQPRYPAQHQDQHLLQLQLHQVDQQGTGAGLYEHDGHNYDQGPGQGLLSHSALQQHQQHQHQHQHQQAYAEYGSLPLQPAPPRPAGGGSFPASRQSAAGSRTKASSRASSSAGARAGSSRRRNRTPGSPSRRGGNNRDDDSDSAGSGTITGSIMDHNDPASDLEDGGLPLQQHYRQGGGPLSEDEAAIEAALRSIGAGGVGLAAPDPASRQHSAAHHLYASGEDGADLFAMYNSRTPRSTEIPGAAVASRPRMVQAGERERALGSVPDMSEQAGGAEFAEAVRNLQSVPAAASAEQRRRMSEVSTHYTAMVRNILDSVSELSRSQAAEEEGSADTNPAPAPGAGPGPSGAEVGGGAGASGSRGTQSSGRALGGGRVVRGAALEAGDSGIGAELAGLMEDLNLAEGSLDSLPAAGNTAAGPAAATALDPFLSGRARAALDAAGSHLSDDNFAYTPFTQDGTEGGALSLAGSGGQRTYTDRDIEQLIRTATTGTGTGDSDSGSDGDTEGEGAADSHPAAKKRRGKKPKGGKARSSVGSVGSGGARAGSGVQNKQPSTAGDYSMDFEHESGAASLASAGSKGQGRTHDPTGTAAQSRAKATPGALDSERQQLKLGGGTAGQSTPRRRVHSTHSRSNRSNRSALLSNTDS